MYKNQKPDRSIKDVIVTFVKEKKPETLVQLIRYVQGTTGLPEKEVIVLLNQLEDEAQIHFNLKQEHSKVSIGTYFFSSQSAWYWIIMAVAIVTVITVFTIPQYWIPLSYIRNILGVIFVLFLPGYAFIKAFFPIKVPIKTSSESLDTIERVVLSIGMSVALTPIVGLILYYTPFGIGLTPITLSLLALSAFFATLAVTREHHAKSNPVSTNY